MRGRVKTQFKMVSRSGKVQKLHTAWLVVLSLCLFVSVSWSEPQQSQPAQQQSSPSSQPALPSLQAPSQSSSKISTEVKLVTVYASVRDKHGKIISNLNQSDFVLEEDTRPQTIKYFARESDLPLTLGLLVDTSLSQRRVLDQEK